MTTITNHGKDVRVVDGTFLRHWLGLVDVTGFVEDSGDSQTEVSTEQVYDQRAADVCRLQSRIITTR